MGAAASKKLSPPAAQPGDILRQRPGRQRTGGHHHNSVGWDRVHPLPPHGDERVRQYSRRHRAGKRVPIHGERAARRHLAGESRRHAYAAKPPHLFLKQPRRAVQPLGLQGVGTHQLRESLPVMGRGVLSRLHLGQFHRHPRLRDGPGRLAARQPRADDSDSIHRPIPPPARPSPAPPGPRPRHGALFQSRSPRSGRQHRRCAPFS